MRTWISLLLLIPLVCFALDSDRQQPLSLVADSAEIDHGKGVYHYRGHVKFDQGTTHIRADYGKTTTDQNDQLIEVIAKSHGKNRAHYQTKPKVDEPILHAKANLIKWYPQQDMLILIGNAEIIQGKNNFRAPHIKYDVKKQHLISKPHQQGRTVIKIYP